MGCKSALYAANTSSQTLAASGVINFGSIIRRYGCHANVSGGNVVLRGIGYYEFNSNITIDNATAGTVVVTFYKDGVIIPGAVATATTLADTPISMTIPFIIRETCDCESTITAVVSGAATLTNAAIMVEKL